MDFLKIRKKARERAAARGAEAAPEEGGGEAAAISAARASAAPTATPTAAPAAPRSDDAPLGDVDDLEGALVARLGAGTSAPEEGFLTWRPGAGSSPRPRSDPAPPPPPPEAAPEDFTLVAPAAASGREGTAAATRRDAPAAAEREQPAPRPVRAPLDEFFYRPDEEAPEVPAVGAAVDPAPVADRDSAVREEYLTFLLGREEYAVAIERVREVVKAPPVTEVPRAPAHILGVATVRGEVVAVLDPRRRLGLPGAPPGDGAGRIVIVDAGEGPCALLVDAVASVVRLPRGSIEACPQGIGGARAEFLAGIGRDGERLFTVLDLGALLRRTPAGSRRGEEELRAGR